MPTGYTHPVQTGEVTAFPDFAAQCARAFGATIAMRDMSPDAPLTPENLTFDTSYHADALATAEQRIAEVSAWTEDEATEAARLHNQQRLKEYLQSVRSHRETTRRYGSMLLQVEAWTPPTEDHEGLKKFMADQLTESIKFDGYEPERPEKVDGATLQVQEIAHAQWSIDYHREQLAKEQESNQSRVGWVQDLQTSLAEWQPVEVPTRKLP